MAEPATATGTSSAENVKEKPAAAAPPGAAAAPVATPNASLGTDPKAPAAEEAKKETPKEIDYSALKAPEGMTLDAGSLEQFKSFAKELGLPVDAAKKILERDHARKMAEEKAIGQAMDEQNDVKWPGELKAKHGAKFEEISEDAKRAFDLADKDGSFRAALKEGKLSNAPKLVEFAAFFGKLLKEDNLHAPTGAVAPDKKTPAEERIKQRYAQSMGGGK